MMCLRCAEEGRTSKVFDKGGTVTLMAYETYWDEKGQRHSHNPNTRHNAYQCSNGHKFSVKFKTPCSAPGCNFNEDFKVEIENYD